MFEQPSDISANVQPRTKDILTHSRLSCFRSCPRKHQLRYEYGLRQVSDDVPRRIGSAFHALLEAADKGGEVNAIAAGLDEFEWVTVVEMFTAHCQYQGASEDGITPVASELEFDLPLRNPDTGYATQNWRFCGKIDRIVKLRDGRMALMEYKTTSRDFGPGAEYWQRLHLDQQLSLYILAAREMGYDIQTILYDVTRRPSLRPLKATAEDVRKYTKDGRLYANQRDEDETPSEYATRIRADIESRPGYYFARIEIARLEQDLQDCAAELWMQQQSLREAQRTQRWYRNPSACYGIGACDYLSICHMRDLAQLTPVGFVREADVHPELVGVE